MQEAAAQSAGVIPELDLQLRLYVARKHAGMEQEELAAALGVSPKTIGRYERGETLPAKHIIMAWGLATGVDVTWLQGNFVHRRAGKARGSSPVTLGIPKRSPAQGGSLRPAVRRPARTARRLNSGRTARVARPMSQAS